jgi:uncharacterized coiled-coil protein SlyX
MNIYTSETEYLKTEVQRLSALVRAQQITIDKLEQALAAPVQESDAFDCGVYLGKGKDHAIKHHVSYQPAPVTRGLMLVPINPTQEMLDEPPNAYPADALVTWNAMISKAPAQPAPVQRFDHTSATNSALRDAQNRSYQIAKLSQPAPVQEPVGEMRFSAIIEGMTVPVIEQELPVGAKLYTTLPNVATPLAAQQDIQRLSALVRAQQITIDKLEAQQEKSSD